MVDLEDLDNEKLIVVSYYVRLCQGGVVKASSHLEDMALIELRKVMIHGDILNIFRNNDVFDHWLFDLCESVDFLIGLSRAHILFIGHCILLPQLVVKINYIIDLKGSLLRLYL